MLASLFPFIDSFFSNRFSCVQVKIGISRVDVRHKKIKIKISGLRHEMSYSDFVSCVRLWRMRNLQNLIMLLGLFSAGICFINKIFSIMVKNQNLFLGSATGSSTAFSDEKNFNISKLPNRKVAWKFHWMTHFLISIISIPDQNLGLCNSINLYVFERDTWTVFYMFKTSYK